MTTMNQLSDSTMFFGGNAPFVEELYENYLDNPTAVPAEWRDYFDRLAQMPGFVARDVAHAPVIAAFTELAKDGGFRPAATVSGGDIKKQSAVGQLVTAYRSMGTRWAELDPLKRPQSCFALQKVLAQRHREAPPQQKTWLEGLGSRLKTMIGRT